MAAGAALAFLLVACGPQLAGSERQYLAEGYTKLSAWAYIRERPDGHGFSFVFEGKLGEAAILTHLQDEATRTREELEAVWAGNTAPADVRRLQARIRAIEQVRSHLTGAADIR